jgi:hypothetical protein
MRLPPFRLPAALLAAWMAACADQAGPDPARTDPVNLDIALAVADGVGEDVQLMRELGPRLGLGFLFLPLGHAAPPRDCPWDAVSGRHTCPDVTLPGGMVVSRSYAFQDGDGAPMEAYHPELTAAINLFRRVEGSVSRETETGSFSAELRHVRDLTVSGLLGRETERVWNGGGTSSSRRSRVVDGRGSRSYELEATVTVANVIVPVRAGGERDPWPLGGTITHRVQGLMTGRDESRTIDRTVVVTFNGTRFAEASVNGETFTIDLGTRHARPARPGA